MGWLRGFGTPSICHSTDRRLQPGSPDAIRALLESLIDTANAAFPFGYRLDTDADSLKAVPAHMRDDFGRVVEITPLLDRRVLHPFGTRTIARALI
jgi:hypothetical protein